MKTIMSICLLLVVAVARGETVADQENIKSATADTTKVEEAEKKGSFIKAWWESFIHGNVDRTFEKPMDISFALSPYYSQESSVGVGGQLSALFRFDRTDSLVQVSDFTILGGASINGTYSIGIQGNAHFDRNQRLSYTVGFQHQERDFWGTTFTSCSGNAAIKNEIERIQFIGDYQHRIGRSNWFLGAALRLKYITANPSDLSYLGGEGKDGFFTGLGVLFQYDSRDFVLNPHKGIYFLAREVCYMPFLSKTDRYVYCTTLQFNTYHPLWKDAILAYDLFGEFNTASGFVPWQLREEINVDDRRMRGYYSGRYIDNNIVCGQVELRQHIYKRFGFVTWVGAGTMFNDIYEMHGPQILPNYGIGLRFELKHLTNVRMDYGIGRGCSGISFSFAEAF